MKNNYLIKSMLLVCCLFFALNGSAQRQMENLDRGVVAVNQGDGVFVSWRLLGTEPMDLGFNVYRQTDGGKAVKLNDSPIVGPTWLVDSKADMSKSNAWYVCAVEKKKEQAPSKAFTLPAGAPVQQYVSIPLRTPQRYSPND